MGTEIETCVVEWEGGRITEQYMVVIVVILGLRYFNRKTMTQKQEQYIYSCQGCQIGLNLTTLAINDFK